MSNWFSLRSFVKPQKEEKQFLINIVFINFTSYHIFNITVLQTVVLQGKSSDVYQTDRFCKVQRYATSNIMQKLASDITEVPISICTLLCSTSPNIPRQEDWMRSKTTNRLMYSTFLCFYLVAISRQDVFSFPPAPFLHLIFYL